MPKGNKGMSVSVTRQQFALLRNLRDNGYFPSLSSIIRYSLDYTIPHLKGEIKELNRYIDNGDMYNVVKKLRKQGFVIRRGQQPSKRIPILSMNKNGENIPIQ